MRKHLFVIAFLALLVVGMALAAVPSDHLPQPYFIQYNDYSAVPDDSTDPFGPDDIKDIAPRPGIPVPEWACWRCHIPIPPRPIAPGV